MLQLEDSQEPVAPGAIGSTTSSERGTCGRSSRRLWAAGAEAVAVNGERLTPTSAIIDVGPSILVNAAYLAGPYQVTALDPEDLYPRLSASPGFVDLIGTQAQGFGIRVSIAEPEAVDIPAFAGTVTLRYARPEPSP